MSSYLRREEGASTVEFALVVPLLVMLIFGIFQFGSAYGSYLAVTHAAREGARMAAVGQFSEDVVRDRAFPVEPTAVTLAYPSGNAHGEPAEVTVRYDFLVKIPFFDDQALPLIGRAQMRLEV